MTNEKFNRKIEHITDNIVALWRVPHTEDTVTIVNTLDDILELIKELHERTKV